MSGDEEFSRVSMDEVAAGVGPPRDPDHEHGLCPKCRREILLGDDGRVLPHNNPLPWVEVREGYWVPDGKCPGGGARPWRVRA